jgi:hypothetical protein
MLGQEVAVLVDEVQEAGYKQVRWDAGQSGLASGVYFYTLATDGFAQTKKLLLLR